MPGVTAVTLRCSLWEPCGDGTTCTLIVLLHKATTCYHCTGLDTVQLPLGTHGRSVPGPLGTKIQTLESSM